YITFYPAHQAPITLVSFIAIGHANGSLSHSIFTTGTAPTLVKVLNTNRDVDTSKHKPLIRLPFT
ncbi:MAG: hypothetical protein P8104_06145, partial [Gammaproteobacteria bacterium]